MKELTQAPLQSVKDVGMLLEQCPYRFSYVSSQGERREVWSCPGRRQSVSDPNCGLVKSSEALTIALLSRLTLGLYASLADLRFFSPTPFTIQLARTDDFRLLRTDLFDFNLLMSEKVLEKDLEDDVELEDELESELELDLRERFDLLCLAMLATALLTYFKSGLL
jgi:hypothetical protein